MMTPEEQGSISTLNNFFCGMHLLVGMADVVSSVLLQWETMHFAESVGAAAHCTYVRKSESGVVRLVQTACKALCRHGSEQSGVYQSFTSHLATNGIKRNPLASFMMQGQFTTSLMWWYLFFETFGKHQTSY